ncbi:MAG: MlaD family protein [Prevotellaceae bacterium]|jgi:phospholipid/cholesterol/gamma-HCH transport system substrate-binding protein|nr:MlaD family protein [Prevotellaceae bacterium]
MKYLTKEVRIGIAGVMALCVLIYGINYLKGIHLFKPTSYFYVAFSNIGGLTKSSPVFADGYRVGLVSDIIYDYEQSGKVMVEIDVDPELRIPKGSTAELTSELMGTMKLNLLLANNPRERCAIGDTIQGNVENGLMEKVAQIVPQVEKLLPKMDSILTSLNTLLADPTIPQSLHSLQNTLANLESGSRQLNVLMTRDIPQLTSKLNTVGDNFVTISNNLKQTDYAALLANVDVTLNNIKSITEQLNRKDNSLGLLLNDPTLYENLTETTANAATLLEDLKTNPKRYVHFSLFGKKNK